MSSPAAIFSRRPSASIAVTPAGRSIIARTPGTVVGHRGHEPDRTRRTVRVQRTQLGRRERLDQQVRRDPPGLGRTVACSIHGRSAGAPAAPNARSRPQAPRTGSRATMATRTPRPRPSRPSAAPGRWQTGTRLWTRWLRCRDRCRYSRASSRATADQRSSRPSASTDQRARPTPCDATHGAPTSRPGRHTPAPATRGTPPHAPGTTLPDEPP